MEAKASHEEKTKSYKRRREARQHSKQRTLRYIVKARLKVGENDQSVEGTGNLS